MYMYNIHVGAKQIIDRPIMASRIEFILYNIHEMANQK